MKYVSDLIKLDDIEQWELGDIIAINAPTGSGKSHFIKNVLKNYCISKKKNILLLTNRDILKDQFIHELIEDDVDGIITVKNYQSIEIKIIYSVPMEEYDYIVCDEYHYLFNDTFNFCTDLSLDYILEQTFNVKILLSATSTIPIKYLEEIKHLEIIKYEIESNYNYIEKLYFYEDDNVILKLLNELSENEKAIYFTKAKTSYDFSKQIENSAFICSKHNSTYRKHINEEEKQNIVENTMFDSKILFTTIALDNGVNIKDVQLKHIIIDTFDLDTIQQCLGRKRITNSDEKVIVYIKNWNNKKLNGKKTSLNNIIKYAELLKNGLSSEDLIKEYKHKNTYGNLIYDIIDNEKIIKHVNEAMYFKYKYDIEQIELYMASEYMDYVSERFNQAKYFDLEQEVDAMTLEDKLDKLVGVKIFKDEQQKFKEFLTEELFGNPKLNHGSLGINTIKGFFQDNNLLYDIDSKKENSKKSKNRGKYYWIISKKVYEI
jgi:hypothetical protein